MNVVMKRDISMDARFTNIIDSNYMFDLATPYGYGGWFFESNNDEFKDAVCFGSEYETWCREKGIVSEFVRFHPITTNYNQRLNSIYDIVKLGHTVTITLDSEDNIWSRFTSKNRGHIRKAIKEGVEVRIENTQKAFAIFQEIYKSTMTHDNAEDYYYFDNEFFESMYRNTQDCQLIFTAYLDETPIASSIFMYAGTRLNYHLSGQLFEYRKYSGTSLILYEAAKWGCENGFKTLHLGGGLGAGNDALYTFKKSFAAKEEDTVFCIGRKVFDEEKYEYLVGLREETPETDFFPLYRGGK